ncbi:MAG TPA: glycosyltransferase family 39 protein [Gammaproteobacteria bacterium]|nr:glycosyltransferase family 39 protein [Gammaproteobacteria bacterium]
MSKTDARLAWLLLATFLIKLLVAWALPITGDEAYFVIWGKHPDFGFYDHPPMAGWFLTVMLWVSDAPVWLRLPQILITTFIGWAIYRLLRDRDSRLALLVAALYLFAPMNLVGVLITTDTPLLLWSFLSALAFHRARRDDDWRWYLLSGLLLGMAFFSKFFAGLLGVAYFLYLLLFVRRGARPWIGLLWVIAGTLPFIGLNLWWNYTHCWDNYLFNLQNRTAGGGFSPAQAGKYLLLLLYLLTPPILWYLARHWRAAVQRMRRSPDGLYLALFLIPYALFLLLSFRVSIGLHWLLSFYPFVFLGIAGLFTLTELRRSLWFMVPFGLLHVVLLLGLLWQAPDLDFVRQDENRTKDVVYGLHARDILAAVEEAAPGYLVATDSYTESALLSHAGRRHVIVFGEGSYHARQDDMLTDFRQLDGKDIVIVAYFRGIEKYARYFEHSELRPLPMAGTTFYMLLGRGFRYAPYRETVIANILKRYYRIPDWLPTGRCYMWEKYGGETVSGTAERANPPTSR